MKTWRVYGLATASRFLGTVEAETEDAAKAIAEENPTEEIKNNWHISLCWHCAQDIEIGDIHDVQAEEEE